VAAREPAHRISPNPRVGCVLLGADGGVLAVGRHRGPGTAHAEVDALAQVGGRARGATAVVTLEPCDHTGRTGPCTDALLDAGVTRVVHAIDDPDPVAGGGASTLRAAGVEVESGVLADEARALNTRWLSAVARRRPFVTWKLAASLDGRSAAADGSSRWITGPAARRDVQRLRAAADAVVVGTGTALADDPRLTVRDDEDRDLPHDQQPVRVVVGRATCRPAPAARRGQRRRCSLRTDDPGTCSHSSTSATSGRSGWRAGRGWPAPSAPPGWWTRWSRTSLPVLLGQAGGARGHAGVATIADALRLQVSDVTVIDGDVRITATPTKRRDRLMFTGIVEELGEVVRVEQQERAARLTVRGPRVVSDAVHGASISVNGCCLTVGGARHRHVHRRRHGGHPRHHLAGRPAAGSAVNLERAIPAGGRLGGHIVQGHVDGTGTSWSARPGRTGSLVRISVPDALARYVVARDPSPSTGRR
jgi:diaminohydroxyphosphoribosylaminopyrimidine deaminase/5-amino-6-(5-phosphoribosylamino)uracil reductase